MNTRLALLVVALAVAGCESPSGPLDSSPVAGTWAYEGTQQNPQGSIAGTIVWLSVAGGSFEGPANLSETLSGQVRALVGLSAGSILTDSVADFDIVLLNIARRHFGIVRGDSISGSWMEQGAGAAASGTFVMRRGTDN